VFCFVLFYDALLARPSAALDSTHDCCSAVSYGCGPARSTVAAAVAVVWQFSSSWVHNNNWKHRKHRKHSFLCARQQEALSCTLSSPECRTNCRLMHRSFLHIGAQAHRLPIHCEPCVGWTF